MEGLGEGGYQSGVGKREEVEWRTENGEGEGMRRRRRSMGHFLGGNADGDAPALPLHDKNMQLRHLLDISQVLSEAGSAIIDDSFTRCFKSNAPEPWNV